MIQLLVITFWWYLLVPAAFASVICFFQINSAWADAKKWNGKIAAVGIALAFVAVYFLIQAVKHSN